MNIKLNLMVLRCTNIEVSKTFYETLGFTFQKEKHGNGPEHFASENHGFVLELYPLGLNEKSDNVRLGFSVSKFKLLSHQLESSANVTVFTSNENMLIIQDPDGRKVEIRTFIH